MATLMDQWADGHPSHCFKSALFVDFIPILSTQARVN